MIESNSPAEYASRELAARVLAARRPRLDAPTASHRRPAPTTRALDRATAPVITDVHETMDIAPFASRARRPTTGRMDSNGIQRRSASIFVGRVAGARRRVRSLDVSPRIRASVGDGTRDRDDGTRREIQCGCSPTAGPGAEVLDRGGV